MSDTFPVHNGLIKGDALTSLIFKFTLQYAIESIQAKHEGLKLNDTHQLLVFAHQVNTMGGNIHTIKKTKEALAVASKETGLEVDAQKTASRIKLQHKDR